MPRPVTGYVYRERGGTVAIRWVEDGRRPRKGGFRTKTAAREWFNETVAPRLRRGGPSAEMTFAEFTELYLARWAPDRSPRTVETLRAWLVPATRTFGTFTLRELEGAADDIARWRATLPSEDRRFKSTRALRQVLAAAQRWGYVDRNPAVVMGRNTAPRREETRPLSPAEVEKILKELRPRDRAIVLFAVETGLRTHEWVALHRQDVDHAGPAVVVRRRFSGGRLVPYPKTDRSQRRVPLTPRAVEALEWLPPRIDTPILFPASGGGFVNLNNWRNRVWYPALTGAGLAKRGPYVCRHTFATNALRGGVPIYDLARLMGASVKVIDSTYGHMAHDSEAHLRRLLSEAGAAGLERENG